MRRLIVYAWASPTTALGVMAGVLTLMTGGRGYRIGPIVEFHGGFARWLLERRMVSASAMTLGHVVIGRNVEALEICRAHELAHVRQVEMWGPFFLPAYVAASALAASAGHHYYYDNWFERDARARCGDPEPKAARKGPRKLRRR